MDLEVTQLRDVFVDANDFEEEEDVDELFEDSVIEGAKFKLAKPINSDENDILICKVYNPELLKDDQAEGTGRKKDKAWYHQLMLMREAIFLKELSHPAIVNFKGLNLYNKIIKFDSDDDDDDDDKEVEYTNPTIFLEFLKNKSLQNVIENDIPYDLVKRQIGMIGVAAAVNFLHKKNILHRNLNPGTIWLDEDMHPKIFDFSSSRECSPELDTQKTLMETKSLYYQSPEIFQNVEEYSFPVDVFSLGRLLYLFATGTEPFKASNDPLRKESVFNLMGKIAQEQCPVFPNTMPQELQDLLKRCWLYNPSARPTAREIYYTLIWDKKCRIVEFNEEIEEYIEKIAIFEQDAIINKLEVNMTTEVCIDIPEIYIDPNQASKSAVPDTTQEQITMLLNIISSNFAERNEEIVLQLLNKMAQNKSIFTENYLPKVINYVNNLSSKGNKLADQFLTTVFGDYINIPSEKTQLTIGCLDSNITKANIPNWVTKIGKKAFSDFKNLERVNIPNSVTEIEDEAFSDCPNLTFINIPESIENTKLGARVFKNCKQLSYIQIPSKLTKIQEATFKGDKNLSNVVFGNGLRVIGKEAFYGCESLKYLEIPPHVKTFEVKAFHHCSKLDKIYYLGKRKPKIEKKALSWKVKEYP